MLVEPAERDVRRLVDDRALASWTDRGERERLRRDVDVLRSAAVVPSTEAMRCAEGVVPVAPELQLEVRAVGLGLPAGARGAVGEVR
jgi:hypothetical protein